jgi:hypothetical protein
MVAQIPDLWLMVLGHLGVVSLFKKATTSPSLPVPWQENLARKVKRKGGFIHAISFPLVLPVPKLGAPSL